MRGYLLEVTGRNGRASVQARLPIGPQRRGSRRRYRSASFAVGKYGKRGAYLRALDGLHALRQGRRVRR